jgi:hypothetical protein
MLYARSFITCDNTHFRTIFFSPGDRSLMGWGKAGVIYCMDSLPAHPFLAYTSALTHLLTSGSKETKPAPWVSGGKTGPSYLIQ